MYNEVLLNVGSIIEIQEDIKAEIYVIIGRRIVNHSNVKAWDYYAVPYPQGIQKTEDGIDTNGIYINHNQIKRVVHDCKVKSSRKGNLVRDDIEQTKALLKALATEFAK